MKWKKLWEQFVVILKLIVKLLGTKNPEENEEMRGPIIKEHLTNSSAGGGGFRTFNVKSDGRALRVFVKYTQTGTANVTTTVKPLAHFSDAKAAIDFPEISSGQTDGVVVPDQGSVVTNTAADHSFAIFVASTFSASEYVVKIVPTSPSSISGLYVVTELV